MRGGTIILTWTAFVGNFDVLWQPWARIGDCRVCAWIGVELALPLLLAYLHDGLQQRILKAQNYV